MKYAEYTHALLLSNDERLTSSAKQIAQAFAIHLADPDHCVRGEYRRDIAAAMKMSLPTANRAIDLLCATGWLERVAGPRPGHPAVMRLTIPAEFAVKRERDRWTPVDRASWQRRYDAIYFPAGTA